MQMNPTTGYLSWVLSGGLSEVPNVRVLAVIRDPIEHFISYWRFLRRQESSRLPPVLSLVLNLTRAFRARRMTAEQLKPYGVDDPSLMRTGGLFADSLRALARIFKQNRTRNSAKPAGGAQEEGSPLDFDGGRPKEQQQGGKQRLLILHLDQIKFAPLQTYNSLVLPFVGSNTRIEKDFGAVGTHRQAWGMMSGVQNHQQLPAHWAEGRSFQDDDVLPFSPYFDEVPYEMNFDLCRAHFRKLRSSLQNLFRDEYDRLDQLLGSPLAPLARGPCDKEGRTQLKRRLQTLPPKGWP